MAKNMYVEQKLIKLVGTLDKNEDGKFICTVEDKNFTQVYNVDELLEAMVGTEVSISSVDELA